MIISRLLTIILFCTQIPFTSYAQQGSQSRPANRLYPSRSYATDISLENSKQDQGNLPALAQKAAGAYLHYNTGSSLVNAPYKGNYYPIVVQTDEDGHCLQSLYPIKESKVDQEAINSITFIHSYSPKIMALYGSRAIGVGITCVVTNDALQAENSSRLKYFTELPNNLKSLEPYRFDNSSRGQYPTDRKTPEGKNDIRLYINKLANAMSYYISGDDAKGVDKIPIIIAYEGNFETLSMQKVDQLPIYNIETMEFRYNFSPKKRKFQAKDCLMVIVLKDKK